MHLPALTLRANALLYVAKLLTNRDRLVRVASGRHSRTVLGDDFADCRNRAGYIIAKKNFWARLVNTVNGAIVACAALVLFGASFFSMMIAMTISVLIAMSLQNYPQNWRLAPNTSVVLMGAALSGTGLTDEMRLAMYRVLEVLTGSTVALLQTIVYGYAIQRWKA